jgi:hypothetical protein
VRSVFEGPEAGVHGRELALRPRFAWAVPAGLTLVVVTVLEVATFVEVTRTIGTPWAVVLLLLCSAAGRARLRSSRLSGDGVGGGGRESNPPGPDAGPHRF